MLFIKFSIRLDEYHTYLYIMHPRVYYRNIIFDSEIRKYIYPAYKAHQIISWADIL